VNVASLRIYAGHNVLNHAILSGGVQTLEDDQNRPAVLRVEFLLQAAEHAFAGIEYVLRALADPFALRAGESFSLTD